MSFAAQPASSEPTKLLEEALTQQIIAAAIEGRRQLGPGCSNLHMKRVCVTNWRSGRLLSGGKWKFPLLIRASLEAILGVHEAQLLTYLRLSGKRRALRVPW